MTKRTPSPRPQVVNQLRSLEELRHHRRHLETGNGSTRPDTGNHCTAAMMSSAPIILKLENVMHQWAGGVWLGWTAPAAEAWTVTFCSNQRLDVVSHDSMTCRPLHCHRREINRRFLLYLFWGINCIVALANCTILLLTKKKKTDAVTHFVENSLDFRLTALLFRLIRIGFKSIKIWLTSPWKSESRHAINVIFSSLAHSL